MKNQIQDKGKSFFVKYIEKLGKLLYTLNNFTADFFF